MPLAMAQLLAHLRYGPSRALEVRLQEPRQLATLCRPSRGPLRALAKQSGAIALLLKGGGADADTPPLGELEAARLVLVGPPPVLRRARELVYAWLRAEQGGERATRSGSGTTAMQL